MEISKELQEIFAAECLEIKDIQIEILLDDEEYVIITFKDKYRLEMIFKEIADDKSRGEQLIQFIRKYWMMYYNIEPDLSLNCSVFFEINKVPEFLKLWKQFFYIDIME